VNCVKLVFVALKMQFFFSFASNAEVEFEFQILFVGLGAHNSSLSRTPIVVFDGILVNSGLGFRFLLHIFQITKECELCQVSILLL
jgi:hypothetical protein